MNDLLQLAINAHGGLDQWNRFDKATIHMLVDGVLWPLKGQGGVLSDSRIEVMLHKQHGRYLAFEGIANQETSFSSNKVAIINNGIIVEELINPRESFNGHELNTPWIKLQMIYFGTYAMWEYLTTPFNLTLPGFETKELSPWHEGEKT